MMQDVQKEDVYKEMSYEQQHERAKKYGSFLFCPETGKLCFCIFNTAEVCRRKFEGKSCLSEDPEYQKLQEIQEKNQQIAWKRQKEEKEEERKNPSSPIRKQTKSNIDSLEEHIKRKEKIARNLYRKGRPNQADSVMKEVSILYGKLRKLKEA